MKDVLENLKLEFERLKSEQELRKNRINALLEDDKVKEYLTLISEEKEEEKIISNILEQLKIERMRACCHIFVISDVIRENNGKMVNKTVVEYCIKCGLTNKYHFNKIPKQLLTTSQDNMWSIYKETKHQGKRIKKVCDLSFVSEMYDNLKESMDDLDDKALISMIEEQIVKNNQEKIAKRLNLKK